MIRRTILVLMAVAAIMIAGGASVTNASPNHGKVTLCHAAGLDGTTHYVTLEVGWPAAYGPAGHFYENGTPRAGHEQDYLGACLEPSPSATPEPSTSPEPSPTITPAPTETPSSPPPSSTPSPETSPTAPPTASPSQPATSSTPMPLPTLPPTDTAGATAALPSDLGPTIAAFILIVVIAFAAFEVFMAHLLKRRT